MRHDLSLTDQQPEAVAPYERLLGDVVTHRRAAPNLLVDVRCPPRTLQDLSRFIDLRSADQPARAVG